MTDTIAPASWSEFVGQEQMKDRLEVHIEAAIAQQRPLSHVLLAGPPGFGKTTIATLIANQLGDPLAMLTMPVKPIVLASLLRQFEGGVLLLDEIHRAPKSLQEDLLTLLSDGYLQTNKGQRIEVPWLTIVAATTEPEKVTPALYDRFEIRPDFEAYTPEEMETIAYLMAESVSLEVSEEIAQCIANAAGGVPRNARRLVLAARDLTAIGRQLTPEVILSLCSVDPSGLTQTHMDYLNALRQLGGIGGLDLIAALLRLHPTVVKDAERLLFSRGLIQYGGGGRELTSKGWKYGRAPQGSPRVPVGAR